ncbi:MAG: cofactor-independent phosphoglycerate mutase [Deltaproteobacteria bacterium]|nr:cofactor-independent phosphoglycerate mutase [Deltaproteobacteria bacterium]
MDNKRKYIILVGDGMGDYPLEELGGRTPLEAARTPFMDLVSACHVGYVKTIPEGMEPGSDVANLSLMGYDPGTYHTGRSPLEAASIGISLAPEQVAFRMNLVTLDHRPGGEIIMVSHSSGDISTGEAADLVESLKDGLNGPGISIYCGVAYRHLLLWDKGPEDAFTVAPHDVLDRDMAPYLRDQRAGAVPDLIRRSWNILEDHPVNRRRRDAGLKEANSVWLWGQGRAPHMPPFRELRGLRGAVISAVDLLKGIGIYAGLTPIEVPGATGYIDTNYGGKVEAALEALREMDFVFLHVEAPDEAAHGGQTEEKILAIEYFDERVVGPVLEGLKTFEDYRVMVVSDHLTPIVKKTHTADPTPFAWAGKAELGRVSGGPPFSEVSAAASGVLFESGEALLAEFLS